MKQSCRACGATGQTVPLCGRCLINLNSACQSAADVLPLMTDEIAKSTAKARLGGGGGDGGDDVISFHALEARDTLKSTIKELQKRAGTPADGEPHTLQTNLWRLQKPTGLLWEEDPLGHLTIDLPDRARDCWQIVDQKQEATTIGHCARCGTLLRAHQSSQMVTCPACGLGDSVGEIRSVFREETLDRLNGSRLTASEAVIAVAQLEEEVKEQTIRGWYTRGKLTRDDEKRYLFDDVWELVESLAQKRQKKPAKST